MSKYTWYYLTNHADLENITNIFIYKNDPYYKYFICEINSVSEAFSKEFYPYIYGITSLVPYNVEKRHHMKYISLGEKYYSLDITTIRYFNLELYFNFYAGAESIGKLDLLLNNLTNRKTIYMNNQLYNIINRYKLNTILDCLKKLQNKNIQIECNKDDISYICKYDAVEILEYCRSTIIKNPIISNELITIALKNPKRSKIAQWIHNNIDISLYNKSIKQLIYYVFLDENMKYISDDKINYGYDGNCYWKRDKKDFMIIEKPEDIIHFYNIDIPEEVTYIQQVSIPFEHPSCKFNSCENNSFSENYVNMVKPTDVQYKIRDYEFVSKFKLHKNEKFICMDSILGNIDLITTIINNNDFDDAIFSSDEIVEICIKICCKKNDVELLNLLNKFIDTNLQKQHDMKNKLKEFASIATKHKSDNVLKWLSNVYKFDIDNIIESEYDIIESEIVKDKQWNFYFFKW